jgi:hypothetical protein
MLSLNHRYESIEPPTCEHKVTNSPFMTVNRSLSFIWVKFHRIQHKYDSNLLYHFFRTDMNVNGSSEGQTKNKITNIFQVYEESSTIKLTLIY